MFFFCHLVKEMFISQCNEKPTMGKEHKHDGLITHQGKNNRRTEVPQAFLTELLLLHFED